jgi:hypothetical protein
MRDFAQIRIDLFKKTIIPSKFFVGRSESKSFQLSPTFLDL